MDAPSWIKIIGALYGVFAGAFFPIVVAYLTAFYKKHNFGFRLILKMILRFFLIFLFYGIIIVPLVILMDSIWPGWMENEQINGPMGIGYMVGLTASIILIIVFKRRSKRLTSKT